ncbi:MAG TPA: type II secretion system secretin GspD [Terriglobia bacterium]|nr:type II secretion system secretin GspD [Terriglobia bacterium]
MPRSLRAFAGAFAWAMAGTAVLLLASLPSFFSTFASEAKPATDQVSQSSPNKTQAKESANVNAAQGQPGQTPQPGTSGAPNTTPQNAPRNPPQAATPPASTPTQTPTGPASTEPQKNAVPSAASGSGVSFRLENADLLQFVSIIAAQLKINYIVDPAVKGTVSITTMGELKPEDLFPILQSVLEMNGATAVQSGDFYRIVPLGRAAKLAQGVFSDTTGKGIPTDDRMMMEILPLRFVFAGDMVKMLTPFLTEGGVAAVHTEGNVLILEDTSLNVKRLMEIIEQFDSPTFDRQRIRLVPVTNNVASGLVPELQSIFSAYALSEKSTPLRFIAIDRINSILVVTADPSAFDEVEKWITKLDQPAAPSGIQTFVYRVQNSEANYLARLLTTLQNQKGSYDGVGNPSGTNATGGNSPGANTGAPITGSTSAGTASPNPEATSSVGEIVAGQTNGGAKITVDPVNNALLIQCTAQQYAEITKTLVDLDILPRQVMIEARVYEVTLTGDLEFGLTYFLQQRSSSYKQGLASFTGSNTLQASAGMLVGDTRELMAFLNASENRSRVRVLSAPTVLATDNSDAKIQVGSEVPILTSQAVVGGVAVGGSNVFSNTVTGRDVGIILSVTPRITSTGLVSLKINQEISSSQPPPAGTIQSPSFLKRTIDTHAVVGDSQTIALGGLISETVNTTTNRIPLLGDIPFVGVLFGSTTYTTSRTEIIVLLTPHIIKSVEEAGAATRQLREGLHEIRRSYKKDKILNP